MGDSSADQVGNGDVLLVSKGAQSVQVVLRQQETVRNLGGLGLLDGGDATSRRRTGGLDQGKGALTGSFQTLATKLHQERDLTLGGQPMKHSLSSRLGAVLFLEKLEQFAPVVSVEPWLFHTYAHHKT